MDKWRCEFTYLLFLICPNTDSISVDAISLDKGLISVIPVSSLAVSAKL